MRYLDKIDYEKVAKIQARFGGRLLAKHALYQSAIAALNEASEAQESEALALVLEVENALFEEIEQAISSKFSIKTIAQYVKNNSDFKSVDAKKRDLKKSLFLDLVIAQMIAILIASSGLNRTMHPARQL